MPLCPPPSPPSRFLRTIESGHHSSNPYHNCIHVADVLRSMHAIMVHGGLAHTVATPLTHMACYLVAGGRGGGGYMEGA